MKLWKWQTILAAGLALGGALLIRDPSSADSTLHPAKLEQRRPAPDFLLTDSTGERAKLSDYKGKVVLLNFWATWCAPCKVETPWFVEFENKYANAGFAVLGVAMESSPDGWQSAAWTKLRPYMARERMNYRVMLGDDATAAKYGGVDSLPESVLIDREGRIAARQVGLTGQGSYQDAIASLLRE